MKILHLNDHYARMGGAETILFNNLRVLEESGVENVIVHQHPSDESPSQRRTYCIPGLGEVGLSRDSRIRKTLEEILKTEQPDLIHLYDIGNPMIATLCCSLKPTIQSVLNHSFYCPGGDKYLPFLGKICHRPFGLGCLASAFLTHCNSIRPSILLSSYGRSRQMMGFHRHLIFLAPSDYQASCLAQSGCPPTTVKVLHPFTPLPDLTLQESARKTSEPPLLLFVGRIVPQKGLHMLLRALSAVQSPFRLVVAGVGPDLGRNRELTAKLGLQHRVNFVGWVNPEQRSAYYRQASIVVVPSIWPEPFGLVGIEAMSYAKPVVAFKVGGIPEWLEDGQTGFLIPPYKLTRLTERIDFLLRNPDAAKQMGHKGRQRVEGRFSPSHYAAELEKIYRLAIRHWESGPEKPPPE